MSRLNYLEGAEKFYDLFGEKEDVDFYVKLAERYDGKALELGVGTARLAVQLARRGVDTWGIDSSEHMLRAAERKASQLDPEIRDRLHLLRADVRYFDLGTEFKLIYFPSGSFDHLLTREDQLKALRNVRRHLSPGGVYVFDVYLSPIREDKGWFVQRRRLEDVGLVVRVGYHVTRPDDRLMTLDIWYELYEEGRMLERYHEGSEVYLHDVDGIEGLLEEAGFEIKEMYGNHEFSPFTEDSEVVVIVAEASDTASDRQTAPLS